MKKSYLLLIAVVLCVSLCVMPIFSAEEDVFLKKIGGLAIKPNGVPLKVGISIADINSQLDIAMSKYPESVLKALGAQVELVNAGYDLTRQINSIEDWASKGMDIIIAQPVDDFAIANKVAEVRGRGVKFFAINHPVMDKDENPTVDLYAGSPNVAMGKNAAEYIANKANGKKVKVLEIMGTLGQVITRERDEAFKETISKYPNITIVGVREAEWHADKAMNITVDILTKHPDLFAIFSQSDCMLPGVIAGLKQQNKLYPVGHKEHIVTVACDGTPYALEQIKEGFHDMTLEQSPYAMATALIKGALMYAQGLPLPKEPLNLISVEPVAVTKENVNDQTLWGNYEIKEGKIWPKTEEIWERYKWPEDQKLFR